MKKFYALMCLMLAVFAVSCNTEMKNTEIPTEPAATKIEDTEQEKITETEKAKEPMIVYDESSAVEFSFGREDTFENEVFEDDKLVGTEWEEYLYQRDSTVKLNYSHSFKNKIASEDAAFQVWTAESLKVVVFQKFDTWYSEIEDMTLKGDELGVRPSEATAIENARNFASWAGFHISNLEPDEEIITTVDMNPIAAEVEEFDGAGTVYFRRYVYGMKTQDLVCVKFNCEGKPYHVYSPTLIENSIYVNTVIDKEKLDKVSQYIDDVYGKEHIVGEKVIVTPTKANGSFANEYYVTVEISQKLDSGETQTTRIYVQIEQNGKIPA